MLVGGRVEEELYGVVCGVQVGKSLPVSDWHNIPQANEQAQLTMNHCMHTCMHAGMQYYGINEESYTTRPDFLSGNTRGVSDSI